MELYEALLKRRSIRQYKSDEIKNEDLEKILIAAKHAPTGMNKQTLKFFAIKNDRVLELEEAMKKGLDNDEYSLRGARAMILVTSDKNSPHNEADTGCAMMNIYYAAMSLGLGGCWINQLRLCIDTEPVRNYLDNIGVPSDYICLGMMALGVPDEVPEHKERVEEYKIVE